jgi:hypothetical protein
MDILTTALEIASQGFPVFPVRLCPDACLNAMSASRQRSRAAFTGRRRTPKKFARCGNSIPAI